VERQVDDVVGRLAARRRPRLRGDPGLGVKPRSSSAEISRWTPDLDLSASASFISSNEGEMPLSFSRAWM
jgi:hypothetical protein